MKKIIRITEKELTEIVKKVLNEATTEKETKTKHGRKMISKILNMQGTDNDQRKNKTEYTEDELNNMSDEKLMNIFTKMDHPRDRPW
jgi:hypothetical protein